LASALDCVHATHDIALDPDTGVTTATLDLEVRAKEKTLTWVGLSMDEGLLPSAVSADGRQVTVTDSSHTPTRMLIITRSPALEAGQSTTIHLAYGGQLKCGSYPDTGAILCTKGQDFSYFAHQSVVPFIFDPAAPSDATLDALTRDLT